MAKALLPEKLAEPKRRAQAPKVFALPLDPSDDELARDWSLSEEDLAEVERCRGDANRLRFAVQLCHLRVYGRFLDSYGEVSVKIVNYLARRLFLTPVLFLPETDRPATETAYRFRLQQYLGFSDFDSAVEEILSEWIRNRAVEGISSGEILKRAETLLKSWKIVLPAPAVLEKLIARELAEMNVSVFTQISRLLPENFGKELDRLLETGVNAPRSLLFYLKEYPPAAKTKSILDYLKRYHLVRSFVAGNIDLTEINPGLVRHLAFLCKRFDAFSLRRFSSEKRWALLACFLVETEKTLLDHLAEMHDQFMTEMTRHARSAYEKKSREFRRKAKTGMDTLLLAVEDLLAADSKRRETDLSPEAKNADGFSGSDPLADYFRHFERRRLGEAVEVCREWSRIEERGFLDELLARYSGLRRYFLEFLELPFAAERGGERLLEAVEILREYAGGRIRSLPETAPIYFVQAKWHKWLYDENDRIEPRIWIISLCLVLRDALRGGSVYLPSSRRHTSFWNLVYDKKQWKEERDESYVKLELASEPEELFGDLKTEFQTAIRDFIKGLFQNDFASIQDGKLKLKKEDALLLPERTRQLRRVLESALPRIRIEDLLLEVDSRCGFTEELRPIQTDSVRQMPRVRLRQTKLAALIAHGTNLGISAMGNSTEEITAEMLQNVSRLYLNETTLKAANSALVDFHHRLSVSRAWGDGAASSSDGQRFGVQASSLIASYYPRYFGYYERAVTLYTHVSDQHSVFSTQVISCSPREALYVLDGLLENDTILRPREHYTDTHGFTEQLFGLCYLLDFQFAPRFKDLKDQTLYKIERRADLGKLNSLFHQAADWNLINEQYDQLVRVAASLKNRTAPAHVVLQRLINSTGSDRVATALTNLGRIVKTIYILRYLSDEDLRRRVQRQLNRGESRHNLARWLFFANRGEFRTGDYEEIMNKASCLSLLSNAVLVWNTLEITKIINQLKSGGEEIENEDLRQISPLLFGHVIPNGTYRFKGKSDEVTMH